MPLDPQVKALLEQIAAAGGPPRHMLTVAEARQLASMTASKMAGQPEAIHKIEDRKIDGPGGMIPVRIYTPEGDSPLPVLVYFHGGGWVQSSIETHDVICRVLANAAGCIVVSVDYRLAPEHKFPAAAEDCYAATRWVAEHVTLFGGDATRIAVGGDSSGGNLAAVVALMAKERGGPALVYQLLIYPVTDYNFNTQSYQENAEGYYLTREGMIVYWHYYLPEAVDGMHPYASPLRASDLGGLPPAFVLTAEYDPLRDDGELYAERLRAAGVAVTTTRYEGMIHAFFNMRGVFDQTKVAHAEAAAALRSAFAR